MSKITEMLITRAEKATGRKVTVRPILSGHNKGETGIYLDKSRNYVARSRTALIHHLNFLGVVKSAS